MNKKYRKALIAGNWKMNMLASEAKGFVDALKTELPKQKSCDVAICAPFVVMPALMKAVGGSRIGVGAQDVSAQDKGAYTGEVSVAQLKDIGTKYVIIGHSERRQYHGETDELVNTKSLKVLEGGMTPIICVGESLDQRQRGLTMAHIEYQVRAALSGMSEEMVRRSVIAYEPIWAIGTGVTATADQAEEVCAHIRGVIRKVCSARTARSTTILYGGSMNAGNASELLSKPDIDGGLIGGASLKPADFAKIIAATAQNTAEECSNE